MKLGLAIFFVVWLWTPRLTASEREDLSARILIQRFERTYRPVKTLRATFLERYFESGREIRSEAGIAYFGRPGRMRWEYRPPESNLYVIDGKWSWFYVPADRTVTRIRAKQSSDWRTPLALLAGAMKVSQICAQVSVDTDTRASVLSNMVLRCELRASTPARHNAGRSPIAETDGDRVLFEVNPLNGELARILIAEPGGVEVEFQFANWQFDPPLDSGLFHFEPPKGVAIVDGDFAASGSSRDRSTP